ncbi:MAG: OmpA family protein [Nitrospira defluvii]|nr:OmpA family protein [Nitrospira defluvii]
MRRAAWTLIVLSSLATGCETTPLVQPIASSPSPAEAKLLALQQERGQLLATLGEFHDRIRDLESKLGDRESRPVAASYEQLLSAKEAELADLRKLGPERDRLTGQVAVTTSDLHQARQRIAALEQQSASREKDLAALQTHATVVADLDLARRRIIDLEAHVTRQDTDLRATRTGTAERDSLAAQLQTATTTIGSMKARITALDQQLREREQAYETVRSRLLERDKLVPQYNAMVAEVYQARHRIAALEQRVSDKTRDLLPRQKGTQERPASGGQPATAQREGGTTTARLSSPERSPASNGLETESSRMPSAGRETVESQSAPRTRDLGSTKQSPSEIARQTPGKMAPSGNDDGRRGPSAPATPAQVDARNGSFATMKEELLKILPGDRGQKTIIIKQDGNRLTVALASNWLFTSGDAALTPEGMTMLKRIGTVLGQVSDKFVQVAGHTDNQAISKALQKTFPDNKALSWARAENARRALINGGMPADRTKAVGMADSRPLASNATEQGRQKNRRLELVIVQGPAVASAVGETTRDHARLAALSSSR